MSSEKALNTMSPSEQIFTISAQGLTQRSRNVLYGGVLSLLLALLIGWGHMEQPQTYNEVLLWSVIGFVVLANGIGYLRHRRYLKLARDHRLEVYPGGIRFHTRNQTSDLTLGDIAAVTVYRKQQAIGHIQIKRTDNRGVRLEGYENMDDLTAALKEQVPAAHWIES